MENELEREVNKVVMSVAYIMHQRWCDFRRLVQYYLEQHLIIVDSFLSEGDC